MNLQEMAAANQNLVPVKVIVMNNGWLGMVRESDTIWWGSGDFALELKGSPSYTDAAKAFGWSAGKITDSGEIKEALQWLLSESGPSLLEVVYYILAARHLNRKKCEDSIHSFLCIPKGII